MQAFSNNAVGTLLDPIAFSQSFSQLLLSPEHIALFADVDPATGLIQAITLSDPTDPSVYEIVYATEKAGNALFVTRGQEGTVKQSWGVGTVVSARITAGMLDSFEQKKPPPDGRVALGAGSAVHGASGVAINASSDRSGLVAIGGYPAVRFRTPEPRDMSKNVLAYEAVTTTAMLELVASGLEAWEPGILVGESYPMGPTIPDGNQYVLTIDDFPAVSQVQSGATEPAWNTTGQYTEFTQASEPGVSGRWSRTNLAVGVVQEFGGSILLFPTEVGFISDSVSLGSTPVYVTIEDATSGESLVLNQPLTGILGNNHWHRFTSIPNKGLQSIRFKVVSSGDAVYVMGRFYAKGVFVSVGTPTP
ncbi:MULTISPECIES: hypothetical protein [unclassified Acidovorax]|uniref:hypothetical protein n=1 Tax=unclassified Acidovorax TaxID=2684926 RepID=UPI000B3F6C01|nr:MULTISPECIES: hypothetical protein [unclassified Acidovorax]